MLFDIFLENNKALIDKYIYIIIHQNILQFPFLIFLFPYGAQAFQMMLIIPIIAP